MKDIHQHGLQTNRIYTNGYSYIWSWYIQIAKNRHQKSLSCLCSDTKKKENRPNLFIPASLHHTVTANLAVDHHKWKLVIKIYHILSCPQPPRFNLLVQRSPLFSWLFLQGINAEKKVEQWTLSKQQNSLKPYLSSYFQARISSETLNQMVLWHNSESQGTVVFSA